MIGVNAHLFAPSTSLFRAGGVALPGRRHRKSRVRRRAGHKRDGSAVSANGKGEEGRVSQWQGAEGGDSVGGATVAGEGDGGPGLGDPGALVGSGGPRPEGRLGAAGALAVAGPLVRGWRPEEAEGGPGEDGGELGSSARGRRPGEGTALERQLTGNRALGTRRSLRGSPWGRWGGRTGS